MTKDTSNEMNDVAEALVTITKAMKEHGIFDKVQDISVTYRVDELWQTVTLTFVTNEQENGND